MDFVDYYQILGIEKSATPKDIKSAYRKLARKYHPDLNPNDKDSKKNFQQINEANEVLSDPEKRKKYDQYGKDWKQSEQFEGAGQYREQADNRGRARYSGTQYDGDFSDFFESMFGGTPGGGRSSQAKFRGEDYHAELRIELAEAAKSHKKTITVSGKNLRITIPAGIENGQTIRIHGHGGPGRNGGPDGDLYISFIIPNHLNIKRLKNDLFMNVDLDLYLALLGGEITIETLTGKVKLKVKPETQNGSRIKLKGKGFPLYRNEEQTGDLYVTYSIRIPTNLTEKQKELFTELSKIES